MYSETPPPLADTSSFLPNAPSATSEASASPPCNAQARLRSIGRLPNHRILADLLQLNQQQHRLEADLLLFLGELDQRQLYREHAVSSTFEFCVARLGYSEDVAWKRVGAARLIRRFPLIHELLVEGRIHLTALMLIKPQLTQENHEEWPSHACGKSKRQLEKLVACRCPRPDVPASVRKLPGARAGMASAELTVVAVPAATVPETLPPTIAERAAPVAVAARVAPLSANTYRITFTASERLKKKLDRAGELLSHCVNPSDLPALIERALDQLLEREEKRRFGARRSAVARHGEEQSAVARSVELTSNDSRAEAVPPAVPQPAEPQHESCQNQAPFDITPQDPEQLTNGDVHRSNISEFLVQQVATTGELGHTIHDEKSNPATQGATTSADERGPSPKPKRRRRPPVAVRHAVFERDGGQCTYVDQQGRRCTERHYLEFDHIDPHAGGGGETERNLRLRCACHNRFEAEKLFGHERVKSAIKRARKERSRCSGRDVRAVEVPRA